MTVSPELQIVFWAVGIVLAVNFLAVILHFLYRSLTDSPLRNGIRNIIYELDEFADNMENSQKRLTAIQEINSLLGWRKVIVPAALVGLVIDMEVATIRKMQKAADTPDLHDAKKDV